MSFDPSSRDGGTRGHVKPRNLDLYARSRVVCTYFRPVGPLPACCKLRRQSLIAFLRWSKWCVVPSVSSRSIMTLLMTFGVLYECSPRGAGDGNTETVVHCSNDDSRKLKTSIQNCEHWSSRTPRVRIAIREPKIGKCSQ